MTADVLPAPGTPFGDQVRRSLLTGTAEIVPGAVTPELVPAYLTKYRDDMTRVGGSPEAFGANFPVAVRVHLTRVRGF